MINKNKLFLSIVFSIIVPAFFFLLSNINYVKAMENKKQNTTIAFEDYNFIAIGDWYCNEETEKTIQNILSIDHEVIITKGDQVKDSQSVSCWINMPNPIKNITHIAVGNHDAEFTNIYKQKVVYHNVKSPYYSYDFKNVHFIIMSTEHHFEKDSKQYEVIKNDLKSSNNPKIDWIVVHQHKSLYSTKRDKKEAEQLRDTYHPLFQEYDADLAISDHNQYYEMTYPLLYNGEYEKIINKKIKPQPIIGEFHTNEGNIIDRFKLGET